MEWLKYWFDAGATVATFASIVFAILSALAWHDASALPIPPLEDVPEDLPGKGRVLLGDDDLIVLQAKIHAMFRRTNAALEVVNEASALNAKGARWAMATAAALSFGLVCTLALRLMHA